MAGHRAYRQPRYEFGKQLLTLRTRLALTQGQLAQEIGVHRRSVQNWEAGESYPKTDALQRLIAHCLARRAFTAGHEHAEALALWNQVAADGAQELGAFDEWWFTQTLATQLANAASVNGNPPAMPTLSPIHAASTPLARASAAMGPRAIIDWGEALATPTLHGRDGELETLRQWVVDDACRVVTILGLGGIGKSTLAIHFAHECVADFDVVLFRSLQNGPSAAELLGQFIRVIAPQTSTLPETLPDKVALLVQLLREQRCLLILDNLETVLQPGALSGTYRPEYADYALLLRALGEREHQSCLLLTSREKPSELAPLEGRIAPVRVLRLGGLTVAACQSILEAKDIFGGEDEIEALVGFYGGNPLALNLVAEPIRDLFGSNVGSFLATESAYFEGMGNLLEQQFARSSPLEQKLLYWLVIERELTPFTTLVANLEESLPQREVLAALESLRHRSQIERSPDRPAFTLQPVIMEYLTEQLVELVAQEIADPDLPRTARLLKSHALMQAHAKDYVRHSQERLILSPLLRRLLTLCGGAGPLARQLLHWLDHWRNQPPVEQGFGPGNVVNLLCLLRGDLRGLNLAKLALREVYWQGIEAQDTTLTDALVHANVFTETFGVIHAVAVSVSGRYWAAGSDNNTVHVWRDEGRTPHLSLLQHTKAVKSLAFSPDEALLASGSWDCTINVWDTHSGALRHTLRGHRDFVHDVAFAPDGMRLASGSDDRTVRIWDVARGTLLAELVGHSDNVYGVAWSPDGKWLASCSFDCVVRVWDVERGECIQTLRGHTRGICKVAFAPDGSMLASGGFDRVVRVWNLADGTCVQRFAEHSSTIMKVLWGADGRTLATCSYDGTIRLWQLGREQSVRTLLGHAASVNSLAFTADGTQLLSGSDDQTLRVWDIATGWCIRLLAGYGLFHTAVMWSPDGHSLLSANSDMTLTLWNVEEGKPRLTLRGHTHTVYGATWSPDGHWLASNGFDQVLRIWDAQTGACVRTIPMPTEHLYRMVRWSPDGRWVASAGRDLGVRVWDFATWTLRWVGYGHTGAIYDVVWSPDGQQLVSNSEDHTVRIWRAEDGDLVKTLVAHEGSVAGVAWSPDGQQLTSCGGRGTNGELFVWNVASGARVRSLVGHTSVAYRAAWSHDGKRIYSGGITGTIRWWDAESGENLYTRQAHRGWVRSLTVSPDGTRLVTSGEDGVIHLWDAARAELLQTLRIDRPYERMEISGLRGITEARRVALLDLGAVEQAG